MPQLRDITALVLTYDEAPNIARVLNRLIWAQEVVVVDSHSKDETRAIATGYGNVRWLERAFDDHTSQWNFGLDAVQTPWVLTVDADYVLRAGFEDELASLDPGDAVAFDAAFRYLVFGMPLSASLYPPRVLFFRRDHCRYEQDGHTQLLRIDGKVGHLRTMIDHDDRKPLLRWLSSQQKYAALEAEKLMQAPRNQLRLQDRLRRTMWAAVPVSLVYTLLVKGTIWNGWRGWYYALQRVLAEMLLAMRLMEIRIGKHASRS